MDGRITVDRDGPTLVVTIDRPAAHNALTPPMMRDLVSAFDEYERDDSLRVAILTGAGDRAFCTGGDLGSTIPGMRTAGLVAGTGPDPTRRFFSDVYKPIIAAVRGHCVAGGMEILLGTDLRLATPDATFALSEVRLGLVPSAGSHVRLPRQVPWAVAMEMLLTGTALTADRAREVGLVNAVVPPEELMDAALRLAGTVAANGPLAVRTAKEIAVRALALDGPFTLEAALAAPVWRSEDAQEGPRAFMAKRRPRFEGR